MFFLVFLLMKNIAIFASGSGTNAVEIIKHFQSTKSVIVSFIITNNPSAGVINKAKSLSIPSFVFSKAELDETPTLLDFLKQNNIELIVLAGYLRKIPAHLIHAFPKAIVNIHPALLPEFGGKGMHGQGVHEAVIASQKRESGISIHFVNEAYDEGQIIFQEKCAVKPNDTPEILAERVLLLEHKNYAKVIESLLKS